jgi:hypothetical protein
MDLKELEVASSRSALGPVVVSCKKREQKSVSTSVGDLTS